MQIICLTYVTRLNLANKSGHATYLSVVAFALYWVNSVCESVFFVVSLGVAGSHFAFISLVIMSFRTNSNYDFNNSTCFAFMVSQLLSSVECA